MATYKCLECGHIFDEGEEARWIEESGELFTGCPMCQCAYANAYQCDSCGSYHLSDELYHGLCLDCLLKLATPQNLADWVDSDVFLAEDFYGFYYDSLIANSSEQLRQLLRGGMLQRYSLDKLQRRHDTADRCFEFINSSEENRYDFAEWIKKGNAK